MTRTVQIASYRGPATLINGERRLAVRAVLALYEEHHGAGEEWVAGVRRWGGRITSDSQLYGWGASTLLELPSGRVADMGVYVDGISGTVTGSGEAPFDPE